MPLRFFSFEHNTNPARRVHGALRTFVTVSHLVQGEGGRGLTHSPAYLICCSRSRKPDGLGAASLMPTGWLSFRGRRASQVGPLSLEMPRWGAGASGGWDCLLQPWKRETD